MEPMAIAHMLETKFPDDILQIVESRGQAGVVVQRDHIQEICRWLHDSPDFRMNHLLDLCGVDYCKKFNAFEVVYHLYSIPLRHMLRIRARIPEDDCWIDSVTPIWRGADWHERECFDLVGISFRGHPDMRRILLPENWQGHPLRKDYPIQLPPEMEWEGYTELKELAGQLRQFDFHRGGSDRNNQSQKASCQSKGDR